MIRNIFVVIVLCFCLFPVFAGVTMHYKLDNRQAAANGPAGNGISDMVSGKNCLWFGSGNGLSRYNFLTDEFEIFDNVPGLVNGPISAIYAKGDTVFVSAAIDTFIQALDDIVDWGKGFSFSFDNGQTWSYIPQPGVTPGQNVTWDFTILDGVIWGASFGGGLLKSTDWGATWERTTPDTLVYDPNHNLNHLPFSVLNANGVLWVGTSGGLNKSTDSGETWTHFTFTNQQEHISGNWVVNLAHQKTQNRDIIWACTWKAAGKNEYYAVSKTENEGRSWDVVLKDERAYNFAFDGATVYVATWTNGLFKSPDYGETWYNFAPITQKETGEHVYTKEYYSVYADNGQVWVGTKDGLARTINNGYTWKIFRAFQPTGRRGEPRTYAYPNPFSPKRDNLLNDKGHVRLQYNTKEDTHVTIKIYDYAMDLVTTVCENQFRPGPGDYNNVWDGRNDYGDEAANGVYFYSVEIDGDGIYWGKIMVVN